MKRTILIPACLLIYGMLTAQNNVYSFFATQQMERRQISENPEIEIRKAEIEAQLDTLVYKVQPRQRVIPIVFHIFYRTGQPIVSEQQVQSQLEALNENFNIQTPLVKHRADTAENFVSVAANAEILFCLPRVDSQNNLVQPLVYRQSNRDEWEADEAMKSPGTGGSAPWDTRKYLNVWVVNLPEGMKGYAQMPWGPSESDGIVIDYECFGKMGTAKAPFNEGKTLVHLIGNYLGLYDLWNEYNRCISDKIPDTPSHNASNEGCPIYKSISSCRPYPTEMTMNFMDNTYDVCKYMFTRGQKLRLHSVISSEGPRKGLLLTGTSCGDSSIHRRLAEPDELGRLAEEESVRLFPNPAAQNTLLQVRSQKKGNMQVEVFNAVGAVLAQKSYFVQKGYHNYTLDCSSWVSGIYYVRINLHGVLSIQRLVLIN